MFRNIPFGSPSRQKGDPFFVRENRAEDRQLQKLAERINLRVAGHGTEISPPFSHFCLMEAEKECFGMSMFGHAAGLRCHDDHSLSRSHIGACSTSASQWPPGGADSKRTGDRNREEEGIHEDDPQSMKP